MTTKQNKRYGICIMAMGAAALSFFLLAAPVMTVRANYDGKEEQAYADEDQSEWEDAVAEAEEPEEPMYEPGGVLAENGGVPFSVPGNGELVDDAKDDETKEFLTIQTKNNQTFFVVIDRASATENVYMLSMIDEEDLSEFLSDGKEESTFGLSLPQEKTDEEIKAEEEEAVLKAKAEKKSNIIKTVLFLISLAVAIAATCAVYYYIKFYKPRKDEENAENEGLEQGGMDDEKTEPDDADADTEMSDDQYEGTDKANETEER